MREMNKRDYLAKHDIKGLVRAGVVSCKVLRDMEIYDYWNERKEVSKHPTKDTALRYRIEPQTVNGILKDMRSEV